MNAKQALCATILAALASACAGTPTWDATVFPQQMSYGEADNHPPAALVVSPGE